MNFAELHSRINELTSSTLPGEDAQFEMAPLARPRIKEAMDAAKDPKLSAVMILLYPKHGETHTVLMLRNTYKGVHSAQVSFPGGKHEEYDDDLKQTAIREAEEEVGILPAKVEVLREMTQLYIPPSGFLVQPFLSVSNERPEFREDPTEVNHIIELRIEDLVNGSLLTEAKVKRSGGDDLWTVPAFDIEGHVVWGATAMMLAELKALLSENL